MVRIYTMAYYSAQKKELKCNICRELDRPRACHTEWSESEKTTYSILMHRCGI